MSYSDACIVFWCGDDEGMSLAQAWLDALSSDKGAV